MAISTTIIAVLIGLAAWIPLQIYFCRRGMGRGPDPGQAGRNRLKEVLGQYGRFLKTAGGMAMLAAASLLMIYGYVMAVFHGLAFAACIRNELVLVWLLPIALIDAKEQVIPHELTGSGFLAWCVFALLALFFDSRPLGAVALFSLGGLLMGGGVFLLCRLVSKGGVGMGDIRLFSVLGLLYGMNDTFSIVFFTILAMTIYGLAATACKKKNLKSQVPMGPFVLLACIVSQGLGV